MDETTWRSKAAVLMSKTEIKFCLCVLHWVPVVALSCTEKKTKKTLNHNYSRQKNHWSQQQHPTLWIFLEKIRLEISYESSAEQAFYMKCQV